MAAAKNPLRKLLDLAGDFVASQDGVWTHEDWEQLLARVGGVGYHLEEDEGKRNLGNILEALKYFYYQTPAPVSAPKAKKKAASR